MDNKTTIARIKFERADMDLRRAIDIHQAAYEKQQAAWIIYRDMALENGFCPFCQPAVRLDECQGHVICG